MMDGCCRQKGGEQGAAGRGVRRQKHETRRRRGGKEGSKRDVIERGAREEGRRGEVHVDAWDSKGRWTLNILFVYARPATY